MFVPIDQRKWKDIPAVHYVDKGLLSFSVSKTMVRIPRHRGFHREDDGAMDWDTLLHMLSRDCDGAPKWTNLEWLDLLHRGGDKKRFQYCLNSDGVIHNMRAIQNHSGGNKVDPYCWITHKFRTGGTSSFYHVGSSLCMQSRIHSGSIAGRKDIKEGRQTVFFTAVDPMSDSQEEVITTCQSQERYSTRPSGKCSRMQHAGSI